jgi:hypothetical protein
VIWVSCLAGLAITSSSAGQAPPTASTPSEMEKTIGELRARLDRMQGRIEALERRKPPPIHEASLPFNLVDSKGKARFTVDAGGSDNGAIMVLMDSNGNSRVSLKANDESGAVQINDKDGGGIAWLQGDADGGTLVVMDADGRRVNVDGGQGVNVRGRDGNSHVQLYTDGKVGQVNVYDSKSGYSVVQLRSISTGAGRLTISSPDGSYLLDAGAATDGTGILRMGPDGNGVADTLGTNGKPASELQGRKK